MSKSRTQAQAQWYLDILTIAFLSSSGRTQYADFEREAKNGWRASARKMATPNLSYIPITLSLAASSRSAASGGISTAATCEVA
jgi:hypothetical protein